MGIHSRDYAREDRRPSRFGGGGISGVCKKLIIATVVVFVLQLLTRPSVNFSVTDWLLLDLSQFLHGQVWRALTYAFCHDPSYLGHIVFNMIGLWIFGSVVEDMLGSREFLWFYLTAAFAAALVYIGLQLAIGTPSPMLGASGATMAVLMIFALHFPRQKIFLFGVLPVEARWLVTAYVVIDLLPVLSELSGTPSREGVAHAAHLGGLAFGYLYHTFHWRLSSLLSGFRLPSVGRAIGPRRKIRIYKPAATEPDENLDAKVDSILGKISREGEASLTDREREILKAASQKYKNR